MRQRAAVFVAWFALTAAMHAGVRIVTAPVPDGPADIAQSAGFFVGVREFPEDPALTDVAFAVDDAIDLAYVVSFEHPLVLPHRVVLALSGEPQKAESKQRYERLKAAGAMVHPAGHTDILKRLRDQAKAVGRNGILIVAFATHGVNDGGMQRLLTATSLMPDPEISVTDLKVREIVSQQRVPRALILIDACRQRLTSSVPAGNASSRAAGPELMQEIGKYSGQIVFSAAYPGAWAYDDPALQNGVFTAAVIDGLRCKAGRDENGFVTASALSRYVEKRVLTWIQKNQNPEARGATQFLVEGGAAMMPLSSCPDLSGRARASRTD